jgi:hypothetical protein
MGVLSFVVEGWPLVEDKWEVLKSLRKRCKRRIMCVWRGHVAQRCKARTKCLSWDLSLSPRARQSPGVPFAAAAWLGARAVHVLEVALTDGGFRIQGLQKTRMYLQSLSMCTI